MKSFARKIMPILLAILVVTGCQTDSFLLDFKRVRLGMDKGDVDEVLGQPQRQERHAGREWWYYTVYENHERLERMVVFDTNKVIYAGHVAVPKYIKDAGGIDRKNEQTTKVLESQYERDRVGTIPTQDSPPPTPGDASVPPVGNSAEEPPATPPAAPSPAT